MKKPKLIMTKGLPASGKTTWAKQQLKEHPELIRVNKDDLRAMLFGPRHWVPQNEKVVLAIRDQIIKQNLNQDRGIIVDDTNFSPKHEAQLRHLALLYGAEFEIKDFSDIPLEDCLNRNTKRWPNVPASAILDMWERYLCPKTSQPVLVPNVPDLIICDVDGTVAEMGNRGPYDENVEVDTPREIVIAAVKGVYGSVSGDKRLIFFSGRKEVTRVATTEWLNQHGFSRIPFSLMMRADDDNRRDSIVKKEMYEKYVVGQYNVIAVFDDRPQVLRETWRPLGLPVFDVGEGKDF